MSDALKELHAAARQGNLEELEKLLDLHPDLIDMPTTYGITPLYTAASFGRAAVVELLIRLGSTVIDTPDNYDGWTPMHVAAFNGHASVIETLIRFGSTVIDTPTNDGRVPIGFAHSYGGLAATEVLQYLGAVNAIAVYDEDKALEVRHRVFFRHSLLQRCFDHPEQRLASSSKRI